MAVTYRVRLLIGEIWYLNIPGTLITAYEQELSIDDGVIELLLPPVALFASSFALRASVASLGMDKRTDSDGGGGVAAASFFPSSRSDGHVHLGAELDLAVCLAVQAGGVTPHRRPSILLHTYYSSRTEHVYYLGLSRFWNFHEPK